MEGDASPLMPITVLCQERRFSIEVDKAWTLSLLKQRLKAGALADVTRGKLLRLIYGGRILSNDADTLERVGIKADSVLHVALFEDRNAALQAQRQPEMHVVNLNESRDAPAAPAAGSDASSDSDSGQPAAPSHNRRGFDRLRALGLTEEDVSVVRLTFLPDVQRDMAELALQPGETEAERLLRMEDEWMRQQDPFSAFSQNVRPVILSRLETQLALGRVRAAAAAANRDNGDDGEFDESEQHSGSSNNANQGNFLHFMLGVLMGSWLGLFMIVWLMLPNVSRKFKTGLLLGLCITVVLDMLRLQEAADSAAQPNTPAPTLRGGFFYDNTLPPGLVPVGNG